ncbi:hypothetical protein QP229_11475, partial [Streptococcus agalactiae]|nr:hypothetical protein [Streptococcus agalactiae]
GALWQVRVDGVIARQYILTNNQWEQTPVGGAMIGSKAISQAHIADAAIGTAHIADAAITDEQEMQRTWLADLGRETLPSPVTRAYTDFLLASALGESAAI